MSDAEETAEVGGMVHRATARELAPVLTSFSAMSKTGQREISVRLIDSWYVHRDRTGFPEAAGKEPRGRHRHSRVWNVSEVLAWYLSWVPMRGGAPYGNRNGSGKARPPGGF